MTFSLLDKPMDLGGAARRTLGQSRMLDDVSGMQDQDASGETDPAPACLLSFWPCVTWLPARACSSMGFSPCLLCALLTPHDGRCCGDRCVLQTQTLTMVAWRTRLQR